MLFKYTKQIIFLVIFPLTGYIGYSFYKYFTVTQAPQVQLVGVQNNGYCSGKVAAAFNANTIYKIAELNVKLDGYTFDFKHNPKVKAKNFNLPFEFDTTVLPDGQHSFEIEAIDASYHQNKTTTYINFTVDNAPLKAAFLNSEYKAYQGHTIHAQIQVNKKLKDAQILFLSKKYPCYQTSPNSFVYECFIPIECEEKPTDYSLSAELYDHVDNSSKLGSSVTILAFNFPKQRGFSVEKQKLDNEKEISLNSKILAEALEKWTADSPQERSWSGKFELPIDVRKMTTPFGEIRTTPERGRYLHKGVDLVNTPRCVVFASQTGKVVIKERYLMSGNTIVLDHGCGIFTLYFHLDSFADIEVGDTIKKGAPLGKLGMTGYADAWHLHWELRVNNIQVNPLEWTTQTFWD